MGEDSISLDVHLYGKHLGTLFPVGEADYRFAYLPELVEGPGAGTPLLSNSLPPRREPFSAVATRAYTDGLLPEGRWREEIAAELGIGVRDGFSLLARTGRDCAGAVVFLPAGTPLESDRGSVSWLGEDELGELVVRPAKRRFDPGSEDRMRFTLAGIHHKLALVRDEPGGRWGWPRPGVPSTHIVKPETGEYPDLVSNEMFCTIVADHAGVPVADTRLETIAGRRCIVSRRFDREGAGPNATRLHQEDFCQALGMLLDEEDEEAEPEGPGFAEACGLLKAVGRPDEVATLLTVALCDYILGNGDVHGKNFSLLFGQGGARLAPLYDLTSTMVYDASVHCGMVIAEDNEVAYAYLVELARVCEKCEFDFEVFRTMAKMIATKIGDCLEGVAERARAEGWHAPVIDEIVELAADRAFGLSAEINY